ncbi:hypothetical protein ACP70R_028659 [Stipagrostis hirtigluma subsp. patula]
MAASTGAATGAVHEPPKKITKIVLLLKVKKLSGKAVLPSRGSALAAGYDFSSGGDRLASEGEVMVATDLSIVISEGTYARIGGFSQTPCVARVGLARHRRSRR